MHAVIPRLQRAAQCPLAVPILPNLATIAHFLLPKCNLLLRCQQLRPYYNLPSLRMAPHSVQQAAAVLPQHVAMTSGASEAVFTTSSRDFNSQVPIRALGILLQASVLGCASGESILLDICDGGPEGGGPEAGGRDHLGDR